MSKRSLKDQYQQVVVPQLMKELKLSNQRAVPRLEKVVINLGIGEGTSDKGALNEPSQALMVITGQKPKVTKARLSIAGFRLRQGAPIGLMVTLRGSRMYSFLDKLFRVVTPRLRDFQGVPLNGFDGRGNYSLGISEYTVFPELDNVKLDKVKGLQVTLVTSAKNDQQSKRLLELLGMPFEKPKVEAKA